MDFHFSRVSKSGKIVAGNDTQAVQLKCGTFNLRWDSQASQLKWKIKQPDEILLLL